MQLEDDAPPFNKKCSGCYKKAKKQPDLQKTKIRIAANVDFENDLIIQ